MKMSSVQPRADTPTDTMTDLKKLERVCSNLSSDNCLFLVPTGAYSLSFCRLMGGATVNSFSSVNHMKLTKDSGYFLAAAWHGRGVLSCLHQLAPALFSF